LLEAISLLQSWVLVLEELSSPLLSAQVVMALALGRAPPQLAMALEHSAYADDDDDNTPTPGLLADDDAATADVFAESLIVFPPGL
jgi:hypothetical protein